MTVLSFIATYWYLIVAAIAIISVISIKVYVFLKTPGKEQLNKIQEWLVWAVAQAEKELGSGTGQMKIKYVYDLFITKFPAVAIFVPYSTFSSMVEKALEEFKEMISSNQRISEEFDAIPDVIEGGDGDIDESQDEDNDDIVITADTPEVDDDDIEDGEEGGPGDE